MARAHFVKSARKDNPDHDIKKGDSYWWWQFRVGRSSVKRFSKTRPRPSQLTQSEFLSQFYELQERFSDLATDLANYESAEDVADELDCIKEELESLKSETEDKLSNVQDAFPNGSPVVDTLQEYVDQAEAAFDSFDSVADEIRSSASEDGEKKEEQDWRPQVAGSLDGVEWG